MSESRDNLLLTLREEFQEKLAERRRDVPRLTAIQEMPGKVSVAIGMRRSGKTCLLFQKIRELFDAGVELSQIAYFNFEDDRLLPMSQTSFAALLDGFFALYPENHTRLTYLFLDEVQSVEGWSLVLRRFLDSKQVRIYATGSSAKLLSKEIASTLRGRSISTAVLPFSFPEYLLALGESMEKGKLSRTAEDKYKKLLQQYLHAGGFPELVGHDSMTNQQLIQDYVQVVILRDIVERYSVGNVRALRYLIKCLLQNVSGNFSVNKFYNDLKSQGMAISKSTLHDYLRYIQDAYLVFSVPLFSESVRKMEVNPKKIYAIDPGLANLYTYHRDGNEGHLFENLVYLDLYRLGYAPHYYLTEERFEIDFVVEHPDHGMKLIQVAWDVSNEKTLARQMRALEVAQSELGVEGILVTPANYLNERFFQGVPLTKDC